MRKLTVKYKKAIVIVLILVIYFTLLTAVSFARTNQTAAVEENLIDYQEFTVQADENKAWVAEGSLNFRDESSGAKVFAAPISLQDFQQIQVQFSVDCPEEWTGPATLYIDLYAEGYDDPAQELLVELCAGQTEISRIIDKGSNAPNEAQFRIFCLDPVECKISGLSVQKMAQVSHYRGQIICIILVAIFAAMMLIVLNMGADKLKTYSNVSVVDTTGESTACEKGITVLGHPINAERWMIVLLSAVCFFLHLHIWELPILNGPFLYNDEMGYWTNAATFAGYDWAPVIAKSQIPWYAYGYSLTLVPLFWLFDNMALIYKAAIALNALWSVLSFLVCYTIAKRIAKNQNKFTLLGFSFIISIYSAYFMNSSLAVAEVFLSLTVWLAFLLFIRYEENPGPVKGICLGCAISYVYLTHHRTVAILIAFGMTILLMLVQKKILLKDLICLAVPMVIIFGIDSLVSGYLAGNVWQITGKANEDYSDQLNNLKMILTNSEYGIKFIKSVVGKVWYAGTASFLICFLGVIRGGRLIWIRFRDKSGLRYSYVFFLLAYAGMTAISSIFTVSAPRIDFVYYGRYAECAAGIILLLGFMELLDFAAMSTRAKALMTVGVFVSYGIAVLVTAPYTEELARAGAMNFEKYTAVGINFYHWLGTSPVKDASAIALIVASVLFIFFAIGTDITAHQIIACFPVVVCFWYAGTTAIQGYTLPPQKANNDTEFLASVNEVENTLKNAKIFVGSDDLYTYFDFQTRMIHNTIYPGELELLENDDTYDVAIVRTTGDLYKTARTVNPCYKLWNVNSTYALFYNTRVEEKINLCTSEQSSVDWLTYDFGEFEFFEMDGFSGNETSHRWTNESPAKIGIPTLEDNQDYSCKIIFGSKIPMKELGLDSFSGSIVINQHKAQSLDFTILPEENELNFVISHSLLDASSNNQMELYTPLWSPSDYGSEDNRTLGISIDKIIFTPQG